MLKRLILPRRRTRGVNFEAQWGVGAWEEKRWPRSPERTCLVLRVFSWEKPNCILHVSAQSISVSEIISATWLSRAKQEMLPRFFPKSELRILLVRTNADYGKENILHYTQILKKYVLLNLLVAYLLAPSLSVPDYVPDSKFYKVEAILRL